MGKLISPDPDMWGNPVRRGSLEDRIKDRRESAMYDRKRRILTAVAVCILLSPFVLVVLRILSN